ncbi:MAG: phosphotriesterase-related protein [Gemmataceae bacterium]|nr:phosphotriesterase-related protein [Gemmataceae bacterium]
MATVMTVTGPIEGEQLGYTLMHEHLFLDMTKDLWTNNNFLSDPDLTLIELQRYKDAGGVTLVDQTNRGLGQDPLAVQDMAIRSGLNIILGSGWYREPYYDPYLYRWKTDQIAEQIVWDVTMGIDDTGVRAGIIGEIGAHFQYISPVEERMLRAAARAQKRTGVTLTLHATRAPLGLDQLDIGKEEGVDPRRVVVGHAHSYPHHAYHVEVARRGAFLTFDRMGLTIEHERQRNIRLIRELLDAGYVRHLMLSHDVCYKSDLVAYGGMGYGFLPGALSGILREAGVSDEQLHQMMVENPRRALTGED